MPYDHSFRLQQFALPTTLGVLVQLQQSEPNHNHCGGSIAPSHETSDIEQRKSALAQTYRRKPLRDLFQIDALITREPVAGVKYSSSGTSDEDGDCINCERKHELRNTGNDTLRIQVPVGIKRAEAARVLRKVANWIESRPEVLDPGVWQGLSGTLSIILDRGTERMGLSA